jgi:hypothetical protein
MGALSFFVQFAFASAGVKGEPLLGADFLDQFGLPFCRDRAISAYGCDLTGMADVLGKRFEGFARGVCGVCPFHQCLAKGVGREWR